MDLEEGAGDAVVQLLFGEEREESLRLVPLDIERGAVERGHPLQLSSTTTDARRCG